MIDTTGINLKDTTASIEKEHDLFTFKYVYDIKKQREKDMYYFLNTGKRREHIITIRNCYQREIWSK